jgi:hypothetical protein
VLSYKRNLKENAELGTILTAQLELRNILKSVFVCEFPLALKGIDISLKRHDKYKFA